MNDLLPATKSFRWALNPCKMAVAEFMRITEYKRPTYYFNRLVVPTTFRNKGHATALMQEVVAWFDENECDIVLDINAYGDLDLDQLIKFYSKFGFTRTPDRPRKNQMVRFFKCAKGEDQ